MKVCILGAGAYGLALALTFYRNKNEVTVWTKVQAEKEEIETTHQNQRALPGILIPEEIQINVDLSCVQKADLIVLAIPINFFRNTSIELKDYISGNSHFCIATKGIERETGAFCHEILTSIIPTKQVAVLSGPTFAIDLATGSSSGLTLATNCKTTEELISNSLQHKNLKLEKNNDIIGVEICGAVKNIMAIIAGILEGMKVSETTNALFLTQAVHEIEKLVTVLGGSSNTITAFAGIGDLLLTCNSKKSRNFSLGTLLATEEIETITEYIQTNTVEGYHTLISIYSMIQTKNIHAPLIESLYHILFHHQDKKELLTILTSE